MLFAGLTEEEKARGLSASTFGLTFEDLKFHNGTALVKEGQQRFAAHQMGPRARKEPESRGVRCSKDLPAH